MICKKCGYEMDDKTLICPVCGNEVQLVSDYQVFGDFINQTQADEKKSVSGKKDSKLAEDPEAIYRESRRIRAEKKKKKKRKRILILVLVLILLMGAGFTVYQMRMKAAHENSYPYQMNLAETAFSNSKYEEAYEAVQKAISLDTNSADAWLLKAQILDAQGESDKAVSALQKIIGLYPDNDTAYGLLIRIYENEKDTEAIKALMDSCTNEKVLQKYSAYVSNAPQSSLKEGEYNDFQTISLFNEDDCVIYYTLDGSMPDETSAVYEEEISLEQEGTTVLQAISVNSKGVVSDLAKFTYTITLPLPDPPQISPSSGEFVNGMDTTIQIIVPEGCKAYYSFDSSPTVNTGKLYKGETIYMLEGEHTFYAILVNEYGKQSYAASATYIYHEDSYDTYDDYSAEEEN